MINSTRLVVRDLHVWDGTMIQVRFLGGTRYLMHPIDGQQCCGRHGLRRPELVLVGTFP
jgi:hypothetical protein